MIVKNYRNFFLWIGLVAVLSVLVSFLVPSAPIGQNSKPVNPRGSQHSLRAAKKPETGLPAQAVQPDAPANTLNPGPSGIPGISGLSDPSDQYPYFAEISFAKLKEYLRTDHQKVEKLVFDNGKGKVSAKRRNAGEISSTLPDDEARVELRKLAEELKIDYDVIKAPPQAPLQMVSPQSQGGSWLGGWGGMLLMIVVGAIISVLLQFWLMRRMQGGSGGTGNFGKSRAKDVKELGDRAEKVTFDDVAGCDEAVVELRRVAKNLINRGVYAEFDGELPKGVLLKGPPGTGKTLLAKAMAFECDGTMKALSGSDFVEMFVGVGAARVRDEFNLARKTVDETKKPYIIFIDEFDAIGGRRGREAGGNSERENTLNQILVEMDGVHINSGILVIAATNRVDILDEALLRPGRFDCVVSVDLPDIAGREKIFAIHTRKKRLAGDVNVKVLAARTFGYSGAEIKGACNRAAIVAAERWSKEFEKLKASGKSKEEIIASLPKELVLSDFDEGIDFVRLGGAMTGSQARMSEEEKDNTTYHEGGHAISAAAMSEILKAADPVVKITVMRRARALGYVQYMPDTDRVSFSVQQAVARIVCAMAGRAAQEVYLNKVDTGASNDFEQASDMAYMMVTKWGMSRLGRISVGQRGGGITGHGGGGQLPYGQRLADEIDAEWRRIVDECYKIARYIVEADRVRMEALVKELKDAETILSPRWKEFLNEYPCQVDPERIKFDPAA